MTEITLTEDQIDGLLLVLETNENAVGKYDGVRWTESAAEQITDLREEIAAQTQ
jgi:hypothetical protein